MMKFRANSDRLDPLFAFHFFRSEQGRHQLLKNASQVGTPGIGQPLTSLRACEIPVPPIKQQRAIAAVLGALDDKIEQNRRTARGLERLARAIFRAWFVDFEPAKAKAAGATSFPSVPQAIFEALPTRLVDSEIGRVPEGWEVKALSSVCTLVSGGTPKRSESTYWGGDVPWYSVKDAPGDGEIWVISTAERITQEGLANSAARVVPKGCTIISARGTVGKLAMAGTPMAFNQSCYGLLPRNKTSFSHLHLLMQTVIADLQQRTHGSVFDTITRATFDGLLVAKSGSEVVSSFETVVAPLLDVALALLQESAKLAEVRDFLSLRLLTGSVRVEASNG
jgi:type I restriction enzyme S subunit